MRIARPALALSLVAALCPAAHATPEEARAWLARMSEALATREYDGLFTHSNRRQSETMRIVHRMEGARSVERLVSLDGSGREIVRTPREVHAYLPDRGVVLVEPRTDDGSLLKALPTPGASLDAQYLLEVRSGSRLLGRDVRVVEIRPRDSYRYGYRLWLDEETAMPLRSEICDQSGRPVERIQFTKLDMHTNMPASETEPSVDASGFRWVRSARPVAQRRVALAASGWRPLKVPPGFRLVGSRVQSLPGHPMPVQHLVFSDGFASVSVFIEPGSRNAPAPAEASRMGAASTFTTTVRGYMITAVGEVPPTTVRDIATSLTPVADAGANPPPAR
jgi:sigma-E factor negative regulatory protein RseB